MSLPRASVLPILLCLATLASPVLAEEDPIDATDRDDSFDRVAPLDQGGGEFVIEQVPELTEEQRREIRTEIDRNVARLRKESKLPPAPAEALVPGVIYTWPLTRWNGLQNYDYHGISNFVDLDPAPGYLLDYECGARTYDRPDGYNHGGIDYFTWPFGWLMMDTEKVAVVAAAPGTIVNWLDANPDRSCDCGIGTWNAVYVRHDDGSTAWYGHLKKNSLTPKGLGERVERGEFLGIVGSSGCSTGPHLHFETYDSGNNLVEPHAGPCNPITSWWQSQRPYYDSKINLLTTGTQAPQFNTCPAQESPNTATNFMPGQTIYFAAFYHDQLSSQPGTYRIYRPDGTIWTSWSHSSPQPHYAGSYWYWSFNFAGAPQGIWRFAVFYNNQTYETFFNIGGPFPAGRVPQEAGTGTPLTITHATGGDITLTWGSTCLGTETDYAIYEGRIGDWYSHAIRSCSTAGATTATLTPDAGPSYYLVVPRNLGWEGSYGIGVFGERPQAVPACRAQDIGECCGDGVLEGSETCDGSDVGMETCTSQGGGGGTLSCNGSCSGFDLSGCTCGDGVVDPPEPCDGPDLAGEDCVSRGFDGGVLGCSPACTFDVSGCTTVCGDGIRRGNEPCDGADLGGASCLNLGFDGGVLGCSPTCTFDVSGCTTVCGDGTRNGSELCDGEDVGTVTCVALGFEEGVLSCNATCDGYDTSGCSLCGNNVREGMEVCDGTDLAGQTCRTLGHPPGTLLCNDLCNGFITTLCTGN